MKQVEVTILGQGYLLACPDDGEEQLMAAVAAVDREMSAIRDGGKVKARDRIAVLAALNLAYRLSERGLGGSSISRSGPAPSRAATDPSMPSDALMTQLIERLDAAIGEDGHLL
jgi:cell division protein ZapA